MDVWGFENLTGQYQMEDQTFMHFENKTLEGFQFENSTEKITFEVV